MEITNLKNVIIKQFSFLPAASFLVFTFFVFGPADLYFGNAQELWFSMSDIIPVIFITGIMFFLVLNGICFVLPEKLKDFFAALIWGVGIAFYIQGNFIQIRYGVLDGQEIDWSNYFAYGVINTIVWAVCIITPLKICAIKRNNLKRIIAFSSCIIIAVQLVTLVFLGITNDTDKRRIVTTGEGIYTLSKKKNIVVFILDTFDMQYMNILLQDDPALSHQFEGFTYYDNTVGMYSYTKAAIPFLLTGIKYLNEIPYNKYLNNAFKETKFYNILAKNNYNAGIYTDSTYLDKSPTNIIENIGSTDVTINNHFNFLIKLYQLTATKYFPHILKRMIWIYSSEFDKYRKTTTVKSPLYRIDDVYFNQKLLETGLEYGSDKNIFRFYHLKGAHPPYTYRRTYERNIEENKDGVSKYWTEQARGALQIVINYITQLKKDNRYNDTLMLIMADHGGGTTYNHAPLLMVKDWDSTFAFSVSSIPISYDNIIPMLEERLTNNVSCKDFLHNASLGNNKRHFFYYNFVDSTIDRSYLPRFIEYVFIDGKNDESYMNLTNNIFDPNNQRNKNVQNYTFGDTLVFGENGNINNYVIGNFSLPESWGQWGSKQNTLSMSLATLPDSDIHIRIEGSLFMPKGIIDHQTVKISANGQFIEEKILTSGNWSFIIPKEYVLDRNLRLSFEYPDAVSPLALGLSTDGRLLSVGYKTMTLLAISHPLSEYTFGDTLVFGENGNVDEYLVEGFSWKENWGQWNDKKRNVMHIQLYRTPKTNVFVRINSRLHTIKGYIDHQTVKISANAQFIEEKILTSGNWSFIIPKKYVPDRNLRLSFEYPDAVSPSELGLSDDTRLLSVGYKTMTLLER
jgi:hypothetical protein